MGITQYRLAKQIGVPQRRIGEVVTGQRTRFCDSKAHCTLHSILGGRP